MNKLFLDKLSTLYSKNESFVQVTLIDGKGSIPQELGAKMLVTKEGLYFGTIGGGKIEWRSITEAQELLNSTQKIKYHHWNLQTDIKMTCGGVVTLLFEKIVPSSEFKVAIFGAGHVAQALTYVLATLDCQVDVVDTRKEWLEKISEKKFEKNNVTCHLYENMSDHIDKLADGTFIVSMTMGHVTDLPILKKALEHNGFSFIGVIGSSSKAIVIKKDLRDLGVKPELIDRLVCPIGEDFGSNQPSEIAISIIAQLIKCRDFNNNKSH